MTNEINKINSKVIYQENKTPADTNNVPQKPDTVTLSASPGNIKDLKESGEIKGFEELKKAVSAAQIGELTDHNQCFDMLEYPSTATRTSILADITRWDVWNYDIDPFNRYRFDISTSEEAVKKFTGSMRKEGRDWREYQDKPELDKIFLDIANAVEKAFLPVGQFEAVEYASHRIEEDGDSQYDVLLAKTRDGTWRVLEYCSNPFS